MDGKADELGCGVVEDPTHVHDFNATIMHLLGIDHERLTFKYQGRPYRLTDIGGVVADEIIAEPGQSLSLIHRDLRSLDILSFSVFAFASASVF